MIIMMGENELQNEIIESCIVEKVKLEKVRVSREETELQCTVMIYECWEANVKQAYFENGIDMEDCIRDFTFYLKTFYKKDTAWIYAEEDDCWFDGDAELIIEEV